MKANDLLELAGRNLREAKLRNGLTTLGIGVGVASLVAMLSLGVGLQALASNRLSRSGLFDTVVVFSRPEFRSFERGDRQSGGDSNENRDLRPLDDAARRELEQLPNVIEVTPDIRFTTEVRFGERSQFTMVAGLSPSARGNDAFDNMKGTFFSAPDAEEAILQIAFARIIAGKDAPPESLLGKEITLRYAERQELPPAGAAGSAARAGAKRGADNTPASGDGRAGASPMDARIDSMLAGFSVVRKERKLRIVGITEQEPFGGLRGFGRGRIFIPVAVAETMNTIASANLRDLMRADPGTRTFQSVLVRLSSAKQVDATQKAIEKMGFSTFSLAEATRNLRRFFAVLDLFLGIFGSLALAVASLGIINTLVMAILERRREIGIMKALGASDRDVRRLFFAEAGAMGLAGGLLGVLMGWAIGKVINFGTNVWLARQELPPEQIWSVPLWLVGGAIAFSIVVSLAAGLYPAARAAKLDPVQALRYE